MAILRSLLLWPEVLLLDEPTSNLDEAMAGRVEKLIEVWMDDDPSRCFLWTSHDTRQLDRITGRSIILDPDAVTIPKNGRTVENTTYIVISNVQLALAALLLLINIGLSVVLRLGLGRDLLVGAVRMTVQLALVGLVLEWVFQTKQPLIIVMMALVMAMLAGVAAVQRTGMIPTVNAMMIMGIVSLPGMMTGQILAGAAPLDAVRYQMVIMFMIAACTALATLGVVLPAYLMLFSGDHRLMSSRIADKK